MSDAFAELRAALALNGDRAWVGLVRGPRAALAELAAFADEAARPLPAVFLPTATRLIEAPHGGLVLVGLAEGAARAEARWLNSYRSAIRTARLRVILWLPDEAELDLRHVAPDLDSWIGSWVDLPPGPATGLVRRLRAATGQRLAWRGDVQADALAAVWPGLTWATARAAIDPSTPLPEGGLLLEGADWPTGLRRALRQLAWSRRQGPVLLVNPASTPQGFAPIDPTCLPWAESSERLRQRGHAEPDATAARAGGLVQDIEPDANLSADDPPWSALPEAAAWAARDSGAPAEQWAPLLLAEADQEAEPGLAAAAGRALHDAQTQRLGAEHPDTLTTLHNLAAALKAHGDLAGARRLEEQVLEARARILGEEHPDTLNTLQNLAGTHFAQGDFAGAQRRYEQALEAMTRRVGAEHSSTVTTRLNLARALAAQGDLAGARRLQEYVLEGRFRLLGAEHPETLRTLQSLGGTLAAQGDLEGARRCTEHTLEVQTRLLGAQHPDTLRSLQALAATLKAQGNLADARRLYEQALDGLSRLFGAEHPDTLNAIQSLGGTLYAQGDVVGARKLFERALKAQTQVIGLDHPHTLSTLQNLAGTLATQRDLAGARRLFEQALEAMTRLLGPEHPDTQRTRFNLLLTLLQLDDVGAMTTHINALRPILDADPAELSANQRHIRAHLQALIAASSGG